MSPKRWKSLLVRTVMVFVVAELAYLVVLNTALQSNLLLNFINSQAAPDVALGYNSAWTLWPGDLRVRDFRLRVDDSGRRLEVRVDKVVTQVNLGALFRRRFECPWVRAEGAGYWMRAQPAMARWSQREHLLPPISEVAEHVWVGPAEKPTPASKVWWVQLEDVRVEDVREAWLDAFRFSGQGTVTGRMRILPGKFVDVGPAYAHLHHGTVAVGDSPMFSALEINLAAWIVPTTVVDSRVGGVARALQADISLIALSRLDFVSELMGGGLTLPNSEGRVSARLMIEDGALAGGSRFSWDSPRIRAEGPLQLQATAHAGFEVDARGQATGELELSSVWLFEEHRPLVWTKNARVSFGASSLGLTDAPAWQSLLAEVQEAELEDLGLLGRHLPRSAALRLDSGTARASMRCHFPDFRFDLSGRGRGHLSASAHAAKVRYANVPVRADITLQAPLSGVRLDVPRFAIDGTTVRFDRVQVADEKKSGWWGRVTVRKGEVRPGGSPVFEADLEAQMKDARPIVGLFAKADQFPGWAQGLFALDGLRLSAKVQVGQTAQRVDSLLATAQNLEIRARVRAAPEQTDGELLVKFKGFEVGLQVDEGKRSFVLAGAADWYRSHFKSDVPPTL